ncbi:hypothetical protein [Pararhizobium gei]|uniref:hypothetical protein n=1 Tax=Pararhizobium gei TaxID=1395951 RepID=UPI0023DB97DB|nr:hypothetical protein [Rhizobium gei]
MTLISINAMLQGDFTTPLSPGSRLEAIGKFLGVPDRWDFGIEDEFICQLGYRDFEINLRIRANLVEIERIWIGLWDSADDKPIPKPSRIRLARNKKVDLGGFTPGLPLSKAKAALDFLKLSYEEIDVNNGSEITKRLILPTNSELYFFRGNLEPVLMEIHFFVNTVDC